MKRQESWVQDCYLFFLPSAFHPTFGGNKFSGFRRKEHLSVFLPLAKIKINVDSSLTFPSFHFFCPTKQTIAFFVHPREVCIHWQNPEKNTLMIQAFENWKVQQKSNTQWIKFCSLHKREIHHFYQVNSIYIFRIKCHSSVLVLSIYLQIWQGTDHIVVVAAVNL